VKPIETFDGEFDHLHSLRPVPWDRLRTRPQDRLELEQAAKEQARSYIANRFNLLEAGLH
jgi:hypothetical protein